MKTPPVHSDPEQLVRTVEMQLENARVRRAKSSGSRMAFRVYSLVFIFVLLIGTLFALQYFLSVIPATPPGDRGAQDPVEKFIAE